MGLNDLELTEELIKKIQDRKNEKAMLEAKRLAKHFTLFTGKALTSEDKNRLFEQVKSGYASEEGRDFKYAVRQLESKVYSKKVQEMTELCIANFKQALKDDEDLREKYGKHLDKNGDIKNSYKLWLMERMEAYLSTDMYRRPMHSGPDIVDVIFFMGTSGKIDPRQETEAENNHYPAMKAAL